MNDVKILRTLATEYAVAAGSAKNDEALILHRSVNDLKMKRPVVLIDEHPWHELNHDGSLTLQCEDPFFRDYECMMRRTLYKWRYIPGDMHIPKYIGVNKAVTKTALGVSAKERVIPGEKGNAISSHEFQDMLQSYDDLENLQMQTITHDEDETRRRYNLIGEAVGDIMPVKLVSHGIHVNIWDTVSYLRGVTPLLTDLVMNPEFSHACAKKLIEIEKNNIRQLVELGCIEPALPYIHCVPATASALPSKNYKDGKATLADTWGRGTAQIFGSVSPEMHDEFEIDYVRDVLGQFGLVYYGCCEPLHDKIHIVEKIPNLRKIGITPWADVDVAAERINKKYVLSSKPNPAHAAHFDRDTVKSEIKKILDACKRNGCAVDITLKDVSSGGGSPKNLIEWEKTVMDLVRAW